MISIRYCDVVMFIDTKFIKQKSCFSIGMSLLITRYNFILILWILFVGLQRRHFIYDTIYHMYKNIFGMILLSISTLTILSGCSPTIEPITINTDTAPLPGQKMSQEELNTMLSGTIKVTDPEKLLELQYLREQGLISEQAYQVIIRLDQNSADYFQCPASLCSSKIDRVSLQQQMKNYFNK